MCSIDETVSFCWISKFSEAPPDAQFIIVFYPPRTNSWFLRVLFQVWNWKPGLKEGNIFLNGLQVYKEYCETRNSTVCKFKQLLRYQDYLEKVLFKVAWDVKQSTGTGNTIRSRKTCKPIQKSFYPEEQSS